MGGRHIDPGHLAVRTLGDYVVVPGNVLLRAIRRPSERLTFAVRVLKSLRAAQTRILAVVDDAAIELRDKHDVPWSAIGKSADMDPDTIRHRVNARRGLLQPVPNRSEEKIRAA